MRFDDAADLEHLSFIQDHISREMDGKAHRNIKKDDTF